ncbi:MAG: polysaccharide pyruvyl transferase family protein [Chromatiales bacterium]|nr:polysaccharide pyruvyl transferase family protein [Chromatiales bacterium]
MGDYLRELAPEGVLYIPNPGNGGDSFIAAATFQYFHRIGLSFEVAGRDLARTAPGRVCVYSGGGNLIAPDSRSATVLRMIAPVARAVVVLPHTITNVDELLRDLPESCHLFCRELTSYDYARRASRRAKVLLAEDMAFRADVDELRRRSVAVGIVSVTGELALRVLGGTAAAPPGRAVWRVWCLPRMRRALKPPDATGVLNCFRIDAERTDAPLPERNVDVSDLVSFGTDTEALTALGAAVFLDYIGRFRIVRTNRLHVAIAAAVLGLEVEFFSNNYYKNRAIYEMSIVGRFPKVRWVGSGDYGEGGRAKAAGLCGG